MAYITQSDLSPRHVSEDELVDLTNDDAAASTINTSRLAGVISEAETEVNTYLSGRYQLPFSTVPSIVKLLTVRVTRYQLYARRPGQVEEWIRRDYEDAIKLLERIADGKADLGLTDAGEDAAAAPRSATAVRSSSTARTFSRSKLADF